MPRKLLFVAGLAVGCTSTGSPLPGGAVTQTVGTQGASIEITSAGSPAIAGTALLIPAGALAGDTVITVEPAPATLAGAGETNAGPAVRFLPDGLVFMKPATLTLPYVAAEAPAHASLAIDFSGSAGRGQLAGSAVTVDAHAGSVSTEIAHFTDYEVVAVAGSGCTTDADCAAGQVCVAGACTTGQHQSDLGTVGSDGGTRDGSISGDGGTVITDGGTVDAGTPDQAPIDGGIVDGAPIDL